MQQALTPGYNNGDDECARKNSALLSTLKSGVHLAFRPISASVLRLPKLPKTAHIFCPQGQDQEVRGSEKN